MQNQSKAKIYATLFLLIFAWGLAWPISKIGLRYMDPIWYSASRFMVGIVAVLTFLIASQKIKRPKRQDLPLILSIGLFQMAFFLILLNYGLYFVGAGRAAILVYSTPIWVTPIAVMFLGEKLNRFKIAGLSLGLTGIVTLFNPLEFDWSNRDIVIGNLMLAGAAMVWAGVMIHTRFGKWHSSPLELLPWQMMLAGVVTLCAALIFAPQAHVEWNAALIATILYNGLAATAFGYWASIEVTKALPVVTTSIGFLGVPVVGLISSTLWLSETLTLSLGVALISILAGLALMTKGSSSD